MKPNRYESKNLAAVVTEEDITNMFLNAKDKITDWTERSSVNKGMTKGAAYNILKSVSIKTHPVGISNAIREFGEYLPQSVLDKIVRKGKPNYPQPFHQEPIFD